MFNIRCRIDLREGLVLQLVESVVEVQQLRVELGHEGLQAGHGIQHLHALCVRVEADLERAGHHGHPAPGQGANRRIQLALLYIK